MHWRRRSWEARRVEWNRGKRENVGKDLTPHSATRRAWIVAAAFTASCWLTMLRTKAAKLLPSFSNGGLFDFWMTHARFASAASKCFVASAMASADDSVTVHERSEIVTVRSSILVGLVLAPSFTSVLETILVVMLVLCFFSSSATAPAPVFPFFAPVFTFNVIFETGRAFEVCDRNTRPTPPLLRGPDVLMASKPVVETDHPKIKFRQLWWMASQP